MRLRIVLLALLAVLLVVPHVFSTAPPAIAQTNPTETPDVQVVFTTPAPEVAAAPPIVTDVLPAILGIVASVVAGIIAILTGVAVSRNYNAKTRADILRMEAETKRSNEVADADIKKKRAETDNLEAETRGKIAATDAIKDQLAAEVAHTLAKSNAEAFTDMRSSITGLRVDIGTLTSEVSAQKVEIAALKKSNDALAVEVSGLKGDNDKLLLSNDELTTNVQQQGTRIETMLTEFRRIVATDNDGPRDISKAAIDADSAAAAKDKHS